MVKKLFGAFAVAALASLVHLSMPAAQDKTGVSDLVALIKTTSGLDIRLDDVGWAWNEQDFTGSPEQGRLTFSDRKWLMYLIHWGPIQTPRITVDYVKKRMLDMWGVKFEFSGNEGQTKVGGHDAVWVEAYGTKKIFYTRFIVWNCPQSHREFIADTNYNLFYKTPAEDFEQERKSALSIRCHAGAVSERDDALVGRYATPKYALSFDFPEAWFIDDSPFYVPFPEYEGIRDRRMGSLLGLPSDENVTVVLKWSPLIKTDDRAVMGVSQKVMERLKAEVESEPDVESLQGLGFESFSLSGAKIHRLWGAMKFKPAEKKDFYFPEGVFQAALWNIEGKGKEILVILKTKAFRYGTMVSSPRRGSLDKFLNHLIRAIS
ncbi:MAG: hypothetical protein OEW18_00505 [Candidatus Aminicenantes bacterium]|nr:hypothetical protein [Candidatus Aminicenantes bacterium]